MTHDLEPNPSQKPTINERLMAISDNPEYAKLDLPRIFDEAMIRYR